MALYHLLLLDRYETHIRHVVLYVGQARMRMHARLDSGPMQYSYSLVDIREVRVEELLASNRPVDYALAILAGGGEERLTDVLTKIQNLPDEERKRAHAQLAVMSGLRSMSVKLELELTRMSVVIDVSKNVILQRIERESKAQGVAEGEATGRAAGQAEGLRFALRQILEARFGGVPKWADARLEQAKLAQLKRWTGKAVTAPTLTDIIGSR